MSNAHEPIDLERLPPDIRAAFVAERAARLEAESVAHDSVKAARELKDIVTRLEHLVKELRHALYGKKSEKLAVDDRQLALKTSKWRWPKPRNSRPA